MDNQKDQAGTTPTQPTANRPANATAPTVASPAAGSTDSTSSAPRKSTSGADTSTSPSAQSPAATSNAKTQNTANAGENRQSEGQQTNSQAGTLLDTALSSGKQWIEDSGVLDSVNQLPQSLKDLGSRAVERVNRLSTTQKIVGGAILAAGLGWLATRKGKSSDDGSDESSDSSAYNYGRQRDAGSYGRRSYGYQAPDASISRADSGSPYAKGGSRFGSSGNYSTEASAAGNTGIQSGSGRDDSGSAYGASGASASTDHGSQPSSHASHSDYRSIE